MTTVQPAWAITYRFSWRSDAPGLSVTGRTGPHIATGTLEIVPEADNTFTWRNVSNINITVTDTTDPTLTLRLNTNPQRTNAFSGDEWSGTITGNRANLTNIFQIGSIFGCRNAQCAVRTGADFQIIYPLNDGSTQGININAASQQQLRDSFVLTEVPFGYKGYLPIGFLDLVFGVKSLKKWNSSKNGAAEKD